MTAIKELGKIKFIKKFTIQTLGKELQVILKSTNSAKDKETLIKNRKKLNEIAAAVKQDKKLYDQTRIFFKYIYEKIHKMLTDEDIIID